MKTRKRLPKIIEVRDYHEFNEMNENLKGTGIKCKELYINYDYYDCDYAPYVGLLYIGNLKDTANKKILSDWKKKHYTP